MSIVYWHLGMDPDAAKAYILSRLKNELDPKWTYHSLEHTLDVYASVIGIAEQEGVEGQDLVLLKIAALYHDAGFIVADHDHEERSCGIVRKELPRFGFNSEQIERICGMILSTKIPQVPKCELCGILCDADMDYLGRSDFKIIGDMLFQELCDQGTVGTRREWNELQVRFLEHHHYFTPTNKALREPKKQEHLSALRSWLANEQ
ncbi:MAG TPA: HD domain-containing protein [Flavobacteriales bacterium]|nr:HD domain-containing protein [Flavobacteriales bacterium]HQV52930.1 HD domain-containing protein [Flavobacteriales bacterium]HQX30232.1 HD domain-containing protein [Flavobacteriales bacterium]HQX39142.1 HD domain-containing protein [Flavobacteriales bacterium]HQZ41899.1 HD domain-containing protein [Flavobacteriales bacterium]